MLRLASGHYIIGGKSLEQHPKCAQKNFPKNEEAITKERPVSKVVAEVSKKTGGIEAYDFLDALFAPAETVKGAPRNVIYRHQTGLVGFGSATVIVINEG